MHELHELAKVRAAWFNETGEEIPVNIERLDTRRTRELFSSTRSEIIGSIGAALFFASVVAWRFAPERDRLVQFGCLGVIVWAAITVFRFRHLIRHQTPQPAALARTGLEHYRAELLRRRDRLRRGWIWHGPLLLAGMVSAAILSNRIVPGRLWDALPIVLLLAGWAVMGMKRRLRQAAEVQQEIDEVKGLPSGQE